MAGPPWCLPRRPVIGGFHPDPSVCRVDGTYYLATSSFEYAPGVPVFASADLRSWTQMGNVRHHDGRFWLITANVSDGGGHLLVTAEDPAGPWSVPVRVPDAPGIDPDLAWDEDGACYLTWSDFGRVTQAVLDTRTGWDGG